MWRKVGVPAFALVLTLNNFPAAVNFDQEISVEVSLSCSGCQDSYLRAVFFPSGSNYFGFTKNNQGDWIGTTADKTLYYHISQQETQTSTWSGTIVSKLDTADSAYSGPGNYLFKVIRYTASGSKSGETQTVTINVSGPVSPSPTPSLTPSPRPTATSKPANPATNIPLPSLKPTGTLKISSTPVPTMTVFPPETEAVLASISDSGFPTPAPVIAQPQISSPGNIPGIVITGLGLAVTGFSALLLLKKSVKISSL